MSTLNPELGSREYWREECKLLREMMGQKSFWSDTERASRAMSGFLLVWVKTVSVTPEDEQLMVLMTQEYDRRLKYALTRQLDFLPTANP